MTSVTLGSRSVLALQSAGACDVDCGAQRLCNQVASLAMLGGVPVLSLMLELQHRRPPTHTCGRSVWPTIYVPGIRDLAHLHSSS
jgi:hypothetical protein